MPFFYALQINKYIAPFPIFIIFSFKWMKKESFLPAQMPFRNFKSVSVF